MNNIKFEYAKLIGIARTKDDVGLWVVKEYVLERGDGPRWRGL
jgi:hypothetical protein